MGVSYSHEEYSMLLHHYFAFKKRIIAFYEHQIDMLHEWENSSRVSEPPILQPCHIYEDELYGWEKYGTKYNDIHYTIDNMTFCKAIENIHYEYKKQFSDERRRLMRIFETKTKQVVTPV